MDPSPIFRRRLATQILGLLGATWVALPASGCNGDNSAILDAPLGGGGAGGAASASTASSGGSGGTGGAASTTTLEACFKLSDPNAACPMDASTALSIVLQTESTCPHGGWPADVGLPPTRKNGQCCYVVSAVSPCETAGRPYLVDDRARVAELERGAGTRGWSEGERPLVAGLTPDDRRALAAAWAGDALLEHASVASFARASLALLAAGAPADLVELTHRAALDEVRHARLCFALATAYAGEDVAPGPFPIGGQVLVEESLAALAVSTFKEGCVGETAAAVIAAEQLARATDPAVRAALAQIAADEARHAELAWRTVAWAVRTGGSEVRAAVAAALCEALAAGCTAGGAAGGDAPSVTTTHRQAMEAHGRLDAATIARVVAGAMSEVVAPAARALLRATPEPWGPPPPEPQEAPREQGQGPAPRL